MTEQSLEQKLIENFSGFNDIKIVIEPEIGSYPLNTEKCSFDAVIEYGGFPFAAFELKNKIRIDEKQICKQMDYYHNSTNIKCFIVYSDDVYYYYNSDEKNLRKDNLDGILSILLRAIDENVKPAKDEDIRKLNDTVKNIKKTSLNCSEIKLEKYKELFCKQIYKSKIEKHGNYIFLDRENEMKLMYRLLSFENDESDSLCHYMSAKSFFDSLKSGSLRLSSIESFNDAYESQAINDYPQLYKEKRSVRERLYNGFVMCFSNKEREDKLYNWHMYGGKTEGVSFSIEKNKSITNENDNVFFFAPVSYVKMGVKESSDLLLFLNRLAGMNIEGSDLSFHFRLWCFWQFFFKYDYYKEEMETRLVYFTKDRGVPEWNEYYKCPYRYIQKRFEELPFSITNIILGPRCGGEGFAKDVFDSMVTEVHQANFNIDHVNKSIIKGFKG